MVFSSRDGARMLGNESAGRSIKGGDQRDGYNQKKGTSI